MSCHGTASTTRQRCVRWRTVQRLVCAEWEQRQEQQCKEWEQRQEQRCDRWEEEWHQDCSNWEAKCCDWAPCSWLCELVTWVCIAWTWVSTTVCRVWSWITTTVCKVWAWVTTTVCKLWVVVTTVVCRLWVLITSVICDLWVAVVDIWCTIWCGIRRLFAPNEVSEGRSECIYGWTSAFRITEEPDCILRIVVRIRLQPDPGVTQQQLQAQQTIWEQAIEQAWMDRFRIRRSDGECACEEYRVDLDVQWVNTGEHHRVRVQSGSGRADMTNWFITSTGGTAAHEVGHMLGNVDEYPDANCPSRAVTTDNSIMRSSQTGQVRPRHYQRFADWVSARTCCDYEVAST
jgi:hypothetical protein